MESWAPPPQYTDYAQFLSNMIGGLPDRARQAQFDQNALQQQQMQLAAQQRQQAQETAFSGGVPMVNGQPDYAAILQKQYQLGNLNAITSLGPLALQQQQQVDAQKSSPLWGDRGSAFPPSAATGSPTRPPSSPTSAGSPTAGAAPAGGSGRSVSDIAASTGASQAVAANVARAVGVDPGAPLTDDQTQKVQRYLASYVDRKGGAAPVAGAKPAGGGALPLFAAAGAQYGISPDFLARTAQIESGGNPNAKSSSSSAKGLFEFTDSTAKRYGLTNPYDPVASTDAAARLAADNRDSLTRSLGRAPTDAELYLAHQQGAGGAAKLLLNPDKKASAVVGMKAVIQNGGSPDMTAGQFAKLWTDKYGSGGATLDGNMLAMRQPMQGVAMPAGTSGAVSPSIMPQLAPQPQAQEFQALAPGGMTGLRAAGGSATGPAAAPAGPALAGAPGQIAPQQPAAPGQQPLSFQVPLPKGFTDPGKAVVAIDQEIDRLGSSGNPLYKQRIAALEDYRQRIVDAYSPVKVGMSDTYLNPRDHQTIYQGPYAGGQGTMSDAALEAAAETYFQTGKFPAGMGRGVQGAATMNAIMNMAFQKHPDANWDDRPKAWQDFAARGAGETAGAKTTATREKNLEMILRAADAAIPAALEQSERVSRTGWVPLNKIIQAGQVVASDPELKAFGMANLQLAEHWPRAMNPTGVMRESDRDKALSFLSTTDSPETYRRAVMQLKTQIDREYESVKGGKDAGTAAPTSVQGSGPANAGGGQSGSPVKVSTKPEYDALPSGTKYVAPDGSVRTKQ